MKCEPIHAPDPVGLEQEKFGKMAKNLLTPLAWMLFVGLKFFVNP